MLNIANGKNIDMKERQTWEKMIIITQSIKLKFGMIIIKLGVEI